MVGTWFAIDFIEITRAMKAEFVKKHWSFRDIIMIVVGISNNLVGVLFYLCFDVAPDLFFLQTNFVLFQDQTATNCNGGDNKTELCGR